MIRIVDIVRVSAGLALVAGTVLAQPQAPVFLPPTPCGQEVTTGVGIPVSFPVTAGVPGGTAVLLDSTPLPAGSVHVPALPQLAFGPNATTSSTFQWTPGPGDLGVHSIVYTATNKLQVAATCTVSVRVIGTPLFLPPSPCGQTLNASAGSPLSFTIVAGVPAGLGVLLQSTPLPAGATHNPPLPLFTSGPNATAVSAFSWTPTSAQVGTHTITYVASNKTGQSESCTVTIQVAECFLLAATTQTHQQMGSDPADILLVPPDLSWPVTMENVPRFPVPGDPALQGLHFYFQVIMVNPLVFPNDPVQLSHGLDVEIGGPITGYGPTAGMTISGTIQHKELVIGFTIPGM